MNIRRYRTHSLFWPLIFIGVGLIWLLTNLGILQTASIAVLFRLWPLILIIIGVDLLVGRNNTRLGFWIGVGGVVLILALMLIGPSLGLVRSAEVKESLYNEAVNDAKSAKVNLNLSVADTHIQALTDSNTLIKANLRYVGDVVFQVDGTDERTVTLTNRTESNNGDFWNFGLFNDSQDLRWDIGLSKDVPIALDISGGVGSNHIDLSDIQLTGLQTEGGVGTVDMTLPSTETAYDADLSIGTGSVSITIENEAALNLTVHGGVGGVNIDVPDDAAVQVDAKTGVGSISVLSALVRQSGNENNVVGDNGVWQTDGFDSAARQIVIHYDGGVGSLNVH